MMDWLWTYLSAIGSFDPHLLLAVLVPDGDDAISKAQGDVLSIVGPGAAVHSGRDFVFLNGFLLGGPESKVAVSA